MTFYVKDNQYRRKNVYVPGRDSLIDEVMRGWESKYCAFSNATICITTFNVNGKIPTQALPKWFPEGKLSDFYAVGLQEMDLSVGTYIIDNNKKRDEWLACIRKSLPGEGINFELISSERLVGIFIVLFKNRASTVRTSNVSTNLIPTGISTGISKLGNKGGTAISLKLNDTNVCFVNCHLAAGNSEVDKRNQDFREISQLSFNNSLSLYDHDVVFWFGDLNYRINNEPLGLTGNEVREIASSEHFLRLFEYDQLKEQQSLNKCFVGFQEPEQLTFRPTYKYDPGTCTWDTSEKARAPAWCDRVLYWTRAQEYKIQQAFYDSVPEITVSDHKPVRAGFNLVLKQIDQAKADRLYDEAIREADRRANENLPQVELSEREVDFGEVYFLEPVCRLVTIKNTGKSPVHFKFMVRDDSHISANWLQVTPPSYLIPCGHSTQISLTVVVDKKISWELAEPDLQDILVMSLEHGRDYFIPVTAKYYPKTFGVTLERLMTNSNSILIDFNDSGEAAIPDNVPREFYRLVTALQTLGVDNLDVVDGILKNQTFIRVRNALELDNPKDLTKLDVTTSEFYNVLIRLVDSLRFPLIPEIFRDGFKQSCHEPGRLWSIVVKSLPAINSAVLEYLLTYLTQVFRAKPSGEDFLSVWADILFRDRGSQPVGNRLVSVSNSDPRIIALRTLCAYDKQVVMP
ncbi:unnamed protein product [Auanema sp. JU1783]|nr:unnamed protein product [Auanema sp. JU1783]